jgi:sulfur carrier protein ThiS
MFSPAFPSPERAPPKRRQAVIEIEVRLYAVLRRFRPDATYDQGEKVLLPQGSTVVELINALDIPPDKVRTVFVNRRVMHADTVLQAGDRVDLFPAIAGG